MPDEKYEGLTPQDMSAVAVSLANSREASTSENSTYEDIENRYNELSAALANLNEKMNGINTGISDMYFDNSNVCNDYYNLQGIKVEKPGMGIFIRKNSKGIYEKVIL